MKRRLWRAALAGAATAAVGVTVWSVQSQPAARQYRADTAESRTRKADALLMGALAQQQDPRSAARAYRQVLDLDPRNKAAWYHLGVIAQRDGRTDDARAAFDKALDIDASYGPALFNEAMLLRSGEPDRAIALLGRAVTARPKNAAARLQLGLLLVQKHRDDEAEIQFRRAVADDPSLGSQVPGPFRRYLGRVRR
ncbi:tetratricopeptide repeat protein [Streptomyces sp. NPDC003343]|uniref:tetratricopeptide repeat protein n=1 Tax=Streptomyces sp. NPDC052207 TaxID=3155418 RepID=UPI00344386DC